jgi:hypothetical protein
VHLVLRGAETQGHGDAVVYDGLVT